MTETEARIAIFISLVHISTAIVHSTDAQSGKSIHMAGTVSGIDPNPVKNEFDRIAIMNL